MCGEVLDWTLKTSRNGWRDHCEVLCYMSESKSVIVVDKSLKKELGWEQKHELFEHDMGVCSPFPAIPASFSFMPTLCMSFFTTSMNVIWSLPAAWQVHLHHPLSSIFTLHPLHMCRPSHPLQLWAVPLIESFLIFSILFTPSEHLNIFSSDNI